MDVRNCRKCGKIFNYVMGPIMCPACAEAQEAKFQTVKTYIRENPGVGVPEVARECDVETSQIYQWLREERLQLGEGSVISLECENCGASITSGRLCDKCKKTMMNDMRAASRVERPAEQPKIKVEDGKNKMRFL